MTEIPTKEYLKQDIFSRRLARILRREELEWELPPDRQWIVVQRLRERAHKARRWANIMLIVLVTIGLVGAALLFIDPLNKLLFSQSGELEKITAPLKRQIVTFDARIADIKQEVNEFLERSYSPVSEWKQGDSRIGWFVVSHDDGRALAMGDQGILLYREANGSEWREPDVPDDEIRGMDFYDARLFDDGSALIVGNSGQMLSKAPASTKWAHYPVPEEFADDWLDLEFLHDGSVVFLENDGSIVYRNRFGPHFFGRESVGATDLRRRNTDILSSRNGSLLLVNRSEGKLLVSREIWKVEHFIERWMAFDVRQVLHELTGISTTGKEDAAGRRPPEIIKQVFLSDAGDLLVVVSQGEVLELDGRTLEWRIVGFRDDRTDTARVRDLSIEQYDQSTGAAVVRVQYWRDNAEPADPFVRNAEPDELFVKSADGEDFSKLALPDSSVSHGSIQVSMVAGGAATALVRGTVKVFSRSSADGDWQEESGELPTKSFRQRLYLAENGVALLSDGSDVYVRDFWFAPWRKESFFDGKPGSQIRFDAIPKPDGSITVLSDSILFERRGRSGVWKERPILLPGSAVTQPGGIRTWLERMFLEPGGRLGTAIPVSREFGVFTRTKVEDIARLDDAVFQEFLLKPDYVAYLSSWQDRFLSIDRQRDELKTRINIANLQFFNATTGQSRKEQQIAVMMDFLEKCRALKPEDGLGPTHTECLTAFEKATAPDLDTNWYRYIAERVTPALLLVFLLATMGAGYRYNLRLAALYDSRADALTLWWHRVPPEGALNGSVGELETLSQVMSSEELGFKEVRTPVDTAVDLAKSVIDKTSRMGRRTSG